MTEKNEYIEVGKITSTHGVRGNIRVEPWCDSPQVLASLRQIYMKKNSGAYVQLDVRGAFIQKGRAVLSVHGIDTVEDAQKYRGVILYALREDIPLEEGSFFICDLVGLPVIDADSGRIYGKVKEYMKGAAQDLYAVELEQSGEGSENTEEAPAEPQIRYIPAVKQFIDRVDADSGVYIRPIEGLLD